MSYRRRTIREWRAFKKLTKAKVAELMGKHASTYARLEDNPGSITIEDAIKLAEVFECDVRDIIFFDKNPNFMLENLVTH